MGKEQLAAGRDEDVDVVQKLVARAAGVEQTERRGRHGLLYEFGEAPGHGHQRRVPPARTDFSNVVPGAVLH
jgi:hypothetical protein